MVNRHQTSTGVPHVALQQADILRGIFDFLSPKSVYSTVRVNRAWHSQAAWRWPPESALMRIEPHRQQFYASLIRRVIVPGSHHDVVPDGLDANTFPQLWRLLVTRAHPLSRYKLYLQPNLTDFVLLGRPTLELAHALAALCPRLRSLFISVRCRNGAGSSDTPWSSIGVELVDFFGCCALPVARIAVHCYMLDASAATALLELLAQRPALASLDYRVSGAGAAASLAAVADFEQRSGGTVAPFRQLRQLSVRTTSTCVRYLSHVTPFVTRLSLHVLDDAGTALAAIAVLTRLTELDFSYGATAGPLSDGDLLALTPLDGLQSLKLTTYVGTPARVTDDGLGALLKSLPRLRILKIHLDSHKDSFTSAILPLIGACCRDLGELEMPGK
jgi:hypothetical protein